MPRRSAIALQTPLRKLVFEHYHRRSQVIPVTRHMLSTHEIFTLLLKLHPPLSTSSSSDWSDSDDDDEDSPVEGTIADGGVRPPEIQPEIPGDTFQSILRQHVGRHGLTQDEARETLTIGFGLTHHTKLCDGRRVSIPIEEYELLLRWFSRRSTEFDLDMPMFDVPIAGL